MSTQQPPNDDAAVAIMYDLTTGLREEGGLQEQQAAQLAEALTRWLRKRWGGQEIYIPAPDKAVRNAAILKAWTGRNADEIMRAFQISRTTLYRIIGG